MKATKNELMNILNVSKEGLKSIEKRKQLEQRLKEKGYILDSKVKEGKQVFYNITELENDAEILHNIFKYQYKTTLYEECAKYIMSRVVNIDIPITKTSLAEVVNVNKKTIAKWDKVMIDTKQIGKDGYYYIAVEYRTGEMPKYRLTCREEYTAYMQHSRKANMKKKIIQQFKEGNIDEEQFQLMYDGVTLAESYIEDKFVYRINKYFINTDNCLLKEVCEMITEIYRFDKDKLRITSFQNSIK